MRYDLVIQNGVVVDPANKIHSAMNIGIRDGKIAQVSADRLDGKQVVDVKGKVVIPGGIDMHVHCTDSLGSTSGFYMIASTGITSVVDFAGMAEEITTSMVQDKACGLNVAVLQMLLPTQEEGNNLSYDGIEAQITRALSAGSLGIKILGGHFPLTPEATARAMEAAVARKVLVAVHSGTTEHKSDIEGMRETITLASGRPFILAHINAYCRGKTRPYLQELEDAFNMLRENPNVYSDSHLATMNACSGLCVDGQIHDQIAVNCLRAFGYSINQDGLRQAIEDKLASVMAPNERETLLLEGREALTYWEERDTNAMVSFPVNLSSVAVACAVERRRHGEGFLIGMTSTDGGGIPRNNLIGRILCLHRMGFLSLEEVVMKISLTPARTFGLINKGHLGIGADADITILDMDTLQATMSFAHGELLMQGGACMGQGGTMLITEAAVPRMREMGLRYEIVDLNNALPYQVH